MTPLSHHVSICAGATDAACTGGTEPIETILDGIASGRWQAEVENVRTLTDDFGKSAAEADKRALPAVLFAGVFERRAAAARTEASGVLVLDLDAVDDPATTRDEIAQSPHVLAAFVSTSGTGVKALVCIEPEAPHEDSFRASEAHLRDAFGQRVDPSGKDVSRLCFVSYDPDLRVNSHAAPIPPLSAPKHEPQPYRVTPLGVQPDGMTPGDDYDRRGDFFGLLRSHGWSASQNNRFWTRPGKARGISASWGHAKGADGSPRFYVFTSNAAPLEPRHTYRPWQVYAILEHGGDWSAAAAALRHAGFGDKREAAQPAAPTGDERPASAGTSGTDDAAQQERPPSSEGTGLRMATVEIPPIFEAGETDELDIPPPVALVDGLIHMGGIAMLAGPPKSKKTWAAMHMGLSVAAGVPWFGHVCTQTSVLYIDLELMPYHSRERRQAIWNKMESQPGCRFFVWTLRGVCPTLPMLRQHIVDLCRNEGVRFIVIDPFYSINSGDENSADDMREQFRGFQSLALETGAAILYTHHFAKGSSAEKTSLDRAAGSGVHSRACDTLMTLTPHEDDDCVVMEATVRGFRDVPKRVLRWDYPLWQVAPDMDPEALKKPGKSKRDGGETAGKRPKLSEKVVREWLADRQAPVMTKGLLKQLAEEYDVGEPAVLYHWRKIKKSASEDDNTPV